MFTELYTKIYNFLINAEEAHITATSVIYQGIKEEPWIPQNELKSIIDHAINSASNLYKEGSTRQLKLLRILYQVGYYFCLFIINKITFAI